MSPYNAGNGPGANEAYLSGLGDWAYRRRAQEQRPYDSPDIQYDPASPSAAVQRQVDPEPMGYGMARGNFQQLHHARTQDTSSYNPAIVQGHPHGPSITLERSYATAVAEGRRATTEARPSWPASMPAQHSQHPTNTSQHPLSFQADPTPRFIPQSRAHQNPSWAQVAAAPPANQSRLSSAALPRRNQAMPLGCAYNGFENPTQWTQPILPQQYSGPGMGSMQYANPNVGQTFDNNTIGAWQSDEAADCAWPTNSDYDIPSYNDDPLTRYIGQEDPFVLKETLVVDTSQTLSPSQLLKSPVDSIDASSTTSTARRKKKEIMEGNSGDFKCQHCGAGFHTADDRRHHEYRVHLPYAARPLSCSQCGRRFIFRKDLNRHLPTHGNRAVNAKFFCPYVGCKFAIDGFVRKDHFNRHMATHYKADSGIQMSRSTSAQTFSQ